MTVTTVLGPESREFTGSTIALPRTVVSDEHVPLLPVVVNATQAAMKRSQCRSSPAPSAAAARSCKPRSDPWIGRQRKYCMCRSVFPGIDRDVYEARKS